MIPTISTSFICYFWHILLVHVRHELPLSFSMEPHLGVFRLRSCIATLFSFRGPSPGRRLLDIGTPATSSSALFECPLAFCFTAFISRFCLTPTRLNLSLLYTLYYLVSSVQFSLLYNMRATPSLLFKIRNTRHFGHFTTK